MILPKFLQARTTTCAAWDPPKGAGRDTHICLLNRGHDEPHRCKCSATWEGPNR
jgi:hypothetical protein